MSRKSGLAEAIAAQASLAIANARLYQQTLELSFTDALTGVPNRRQLFLRLENELSRSLRFADPLSLLMIDLDLFKRINDAHGHTVGDGVLRGVALALRRNIRKIDIVARYGGEEFCVVLPRVAKPEAMEVAEKLRHAVAAATLPGPEGQPPLSVTISVGVATLGERTRQDIAGLIEKADSALYEAKRLGRDSGRGRGAVAARKRLTRCVPCGTGPACARCPLPGPQGTGVPRSAPGSGGGATSMFTATLLLAGALAAQRVHRRKADGIRRRIDARRGVAGRLPRQGHPAAVPVARGPKGLGRRSPPDTPEDARRDRAAQAPRRARAAQPRALGRPRSRS